MNKRTSSDLTGLFKQSITLQRSIIHFDICQVNIWDVSLNLSNINIGSNCDTVTSDSRRLRTRTNSKYTLHVTWLSSSKFDRWVQNVVWNHQCSESCFKISKMVRSLIRHRTTKLFPPKLSLDRFCCYKKCQFGSSLVRFILSVGFISFRAWRGSGNLAWRVEL